MLFDERPKTSRADLFDRDWELNEILRNIDRPMIVVTGIRRMKDWEDFNHKRGP